MWKKLGNSASIPLESSLNSISSESVSEMLMSAINNSSVAQEELAPNPEHESSRNGGQTLHDLTGGWTVPQILIDGKPIGGYTELWRLDRAGTLDELLAA